MGQHCVNLVETMLNHLVRPSLRELSVVVDGHDARLIREPHVDVGIIHMSTGIGAP